MKACIIAHSLCETNNFIRGRSETPAKRGNQSDDKIEAIRESFQGRSQPGAPAPNNGFQG